MRKHYVTFLSPGTFFSEQTSQPITEWDPRLAVGMAETVVERHGAKPYAFYFTTRLAGDPVPDGEGGHLEVQEKDVARSGNYFLGGRVLSYDDVVAREVERKHAEAEIEKSDRIAASLGCADKTIVNARGEYVPRRSAGKSDDILLANMRCNDDWFVVENTNSYKSTLPFTEKDVVVGPDGEAVERGDCPERVAYRATMTAKRVDPAWEG